MYPCTFRRVSSSVGWINQTVRSTLIETSPPPNSTLGCPSKSVTWSRYAVININLVVTRCRQIESHISPHLIVTLDEGAREFRPNLTSQKIAPKRPNNFWWNEIPFDSMDYQYPITLMRRIWANLRHQCICRRMIREINPSHHSRNWRNVACGENNLQG